MVKRKEKLPSYIAKVVNHSLLLDLLDKHIRSLNIVPFANEHGMLLKLLHFLILLYQVFLVQLVNWAGLE
jgi:hypothetical protein